jgi:hypothetical protein
MYWIPAIFIFFELIFINYISYFVKNQAAIKLYEKYKNPNLKNYIFEKYEVIRIIGNIFAIVIFFWNNI